MGGRVGVCDSYCKGCQYLGSYKICDFFLTTREKRGCPAGKGCTRKVKGKKIRIIMDWEG